MAFGFFKKKGKQTDPDADVRQNGKPAEKEEETNGASAAEEKQRAKRIKNMKKKFEETVWNSALDTMKNDIPQFVIIEQDPDDEDLQVTKYVCLGFDTKIVDDFANKSDDEVGSIMTAIKSSMDVVIEYGLFDNELILFIPTVRTLNAIKEFEESFDLKFYVVYCTDDHEMSIETYPGTQKYLEITLDQIREMMEQNYNVRDLIKSAQMNVITTDDFTGDEVLAESVGEIMSEDESKAEAEPESEAESEAKSEAEEEPGETKSEEDIKATIANAVKASAVVANNISEQKEDVQDTAGVEEETSSQEIVEDNASKRLAKLKNAVQAASDDALKDEDIQSHANININPQRASTFDDYEMDQYVSRRYYSDDLGLEISSRPFDAMFMQGNPYIPFEEVEGKGYLSEQLNNIRKDCNSRLAKLHAENLQIMRERFILIITKQCEQITKVLSFDDPKARFGYALKTINQLKNDQIKQLPEKAEAYKRQKEADYEERMKTEMQNAANVAKTNFINRHAKEHERELREIEQDLRNNIESEFISAKDNLQKERQAEAKRQLDACISEALKICADEYTKMLAIERQEYARLQEIITKFQNDSMAAEEARINALAEEQRRSNEVTKIREEYTSKFGNASKEFEAQLTAVRAEINRKDIEHANVIEELKNKHAKELDELRASKDSEINTLAEQLANVNSRFDNLTQDYAALETNTEKKYSTQISKLKSEREAWTEEAEHLKTLHKYGDRFKLTMAIIAVVAALGIGIVVGCLIMSNHDKQNAPVVHYIESTESSESTDGETAESSGPEAETAGESESSGN